jgi:hypothetical protein
MTFDGLRALPSNEVVHAYVHDGAMRLYVEGMAARDPDFAEELAGWIDAVAEVGGPRSLAARRWRAQAGGAVPTRSPKAYDVQPALMALAAASPGATRPVRQVITIGALPDFPAEASLELTPGRVHLHVFPSAPLACVALGGAESRRAGDDGTWSVTTTLDPGALRLRIEATDGRLFEDELELVPATA